MKREVENHIKEVHIRLQVRCIQADLRHEERGCRKNLLRQDFERRQFK